MSFRLASPAPWSLAFIALGGGFSLVGCTESKPSDLVPVTGRVTLDGRPLTSGSISLRADAGETWHQPTGVISGNDGEFVVYTNGRPGAPPGQYRVIVFASEPASDRNGAAHPGLPRSLVPKRYNDPKSTPLRLTVAPPPAPTHHDFEVLSHTQ